MKLMLIGKSLPVGETQAFVEKRCRRCIKIFNNDDFYYFFINVEEEVGPLFDVLLKCICLLSDNPTMVYRSRYELCKPLSHSTARFKGDLQFGFYGFLSFPTILTKRHSMQLFFKTVTVSVFETSL